MSPLPEPQRQKAQHQHHAHGPHGPADASEGPLSISQAAFWLSKILSVMSERHQVKHCTDIPVYRVPFFIYPGMAGAGMAKAILTHKDLKPR